MVTSYVGQGLPRFILSLDPELPDPAYAPSWCRPRMTRRATHSRPNCADGGAMSLSRSARARDAVRLRTARALPRRCSGLSVLSSPNCGASRLTCATSWSGESEPAPDPPRLGRPNAKPAPSASIRSDCALSDSHPRDAALQLQPCSTVTPSPRCAKACASSTCSSAPSAERDYLARHRRPVTSTSGGRSVPLSQVGL